MITPSSVAAAIRRKGAAALGLPPPNRRGGSYAVMVMTPILPDKSEDCRKVLRSFALRQGSPLARVPDVHFARWVVIDHVRLEYAGVPNWPTRLESEYLLFSADLTAPAYRVDRLPVSFFRDLTQHMKDECRAVWSHCTGFPGVDDVDAFVKYLKDSQIEVDLYFAAFPDLTPAEIMNALAVRTQVAEFALTRQRELASGIANAQLKQDYMRASETWGI